MTGRMIGPQIVTNFHKLICADVCRAAANCYCFWPCRGVEVENGGESLAV
jgi:hypothetical protein